MKDVSFDGPLVRLDDTEVTMAHDVQEAFVLGDRIIVLLEPDADLGRHGQFRNLVALSPDGGLLWHAELPTDKASDVYTRVVSRNPLRADSFSSFECVIDPGTGKIVAKEFFK